jgi:hydroxymethylpyrimidine/phosphomethylpyrimidine kinase
MDDQKPARILIIAGSDSGGGAGIQADIKTVTMLGGYAMTAVTAITAQNTLGVDAVHLIPTEMVIAQIESVVSDIGVDAVKIGMIGNAETANAVAHGDERFGFGGCCNDQGVRKAYVDCIGCDAEPARA